MSSKAGGRDGHDRVRSAVYRLTASSAAGRWRGATDLDTAIFGQSDRHQRWQPWVLENDLTDGSVPTFSLVDGVPGCYVVRFDLDNNPGTSLFSHMAGDVFPLAGEAEGYHLVRPTLWRLLPNQSGPDTNNDTNDDPAEWGFVAGTFPEGIFRTTPRPDELFCGVDWYEAPTTDLDDYANMDFVTWYELSGSTGFDLTQIWADSVSVG